MHEMSEKCTCLWYRSLFIEWMNPREIRDDEKNTQHIQLHRYRSRRRTRENRWDKCGRPYYPTNHQHSWNWPFHNLCDAMAQFAQFVRADSVLHREREGGREVERERGQWFPFRKTHTHKLIKTMLYVCDASIPSHYVRYKNKIQLREDTKC